jgi:hypothetical protein
MLKTRNKQPKSLSFLVVGILNLFMSQQSTSLGITQAPIGVSWRVALHTGVLQKSQIELIWD